MKNMTSVQMDIALFVTKNMMISDCKVLQNSYQGGTNTCGIHTCVVPILIADGLPLDVFGKKQVMSK